MSDEDRRQLKIKASTVKRLRKELSMYIQEEEKEQARVQKLRDEGADPHDIKYAVSWDGPLPAADQSQAHVQLAAPVGLCAVQENILNESAAMVPDTRRRLEAAVKELQALVVSAAVWRPPTCCSLPLLAITCNCLPDHC